MPSAKQIWTTVFPLAAGLGLAGLVLLLAASAAAAPLNAAVIRYVSPGGSDAANDCTAKASPCQTVQHGLDAAQLGDEIWVAAGVYTGAAGTVANLTQTVTLQGGWNAAFTQNNPASQVTTLDGQGLQPVVVISPTALSVSGQLSPTIEGFVLTHGQGSNAYCGVPLLSPGDNACGGGLASLDADPLIVNNVISDNAGASFAGGYGMGGGLYIYKAGASALISGNLIISNVANISGAGLGGLGGGIFERAGLAAIQGNEIRQNVDSLAGTGQGAGIKLLYSHASILNNLIRDNRSINRGGGIHVQGDSGTVLISGNNILSNTAAVAAGGIQVTSDAVGALIVSNTVAYNRALSPTSGRGGGIRVSAGSLVVTISHNDLYANVAAWGGGSAIDLAAPGVVDGNYLHQNQNGQWGAALVLTGTALPMTATNNVFADNLGGGIEAGNFGASAWVVNNTLVGSRAAPGGAPGSGLLVSFDPPAGTAVTATLVNNLVIGGAACGLDLHNPPAVVNHHNDVFGNATNFCGGSSGAADVSFDPLFVSAAAGNYHLAWGSPAIDAGSNAEAPAADRDGVSRPQGRFVDIGAYEAIIRGLLFVPLVRR